jgi:patatin-like phospholipase/acyl hydrolase
MTYKILSIDGGGLRGIIPLAILQQLDAACKDWRKDIDMFAGTSTGGLIALGLAKGLSPAELTNVYMSKGPAIFGHRLWPLVEDLMTVFGPKYDSRHREQVCKEVLGDAKLGDLGAHVVITAFDLDNARAPSDSRRWKAKIFHNMQTKDNSGDEHEDAYRVGMMTSAAPTYFSSYEGFVDGGVYANNPSMCALAQTQDDRNEIAIELRDVRMLSLGTGFAPYHLKGREEWGLAQWAPHLVDLLMDGVNEVADFQVRQLLPDGAYLRISQPLQDNIPMDDASRIGELQEIGSRADVTRAVNFIKSNWHDR